MQPQARLKTFPLTLQQRAVRQRFVQARHDFHRRVRLLLLLPGRTATVIVSAATYRLHGNQLRGQAGAVELVHCRRQRRRVALLVRVVLVDAGDAAGELRRHLRPDALHQRLAAVEHEDLCQACSSGGNRGGSSSTRGGGGGGWGGGAAAMRAWAGASQGGVKGAQVPPTAKLCTLLPHTRSYPR